MSFFRRWRNAENDQAFERAEERSRMTPYERAVDQEDFEGKKDDIRIRGSWIGSETEAAAGDDLE